MILTNRAVKARFSSGPTLRARDGLRARESRMQGVCNGIPQGTPSRHGGVTPMSPPLGLVSFTPFRRSGTFV